MVAGAPQDAGFLQMPAKLLNVLHNLLGWGRFGIPAAGAIRERLRREVTP